METEKKEKRLSAEMLSKLYRKEEAHPVASTFVLAFLVTLAVETASRHSLFKGFGFLFTHPFCFFINMMIVLVPLSLAFFFQKRLFFLAVSAVCWLAPGLINAVVLSFRNTPFGVSDILLLPSVFSVIHVYLGLWQILLAAALFLLTVAALVVLFLKARKHAVSYRLAAAFFAAAVAAAAGSYSLTVIGHKEERAATFANIRDAYDRYGFIYCFCTSAFDRGIVKPGFYSKASVNWLMKTLKDVPTPEVLPNIIMVQLESFFDVSYLDDVTCGENPIPNFTDLKEHFSTGFLTVPSVGAGTANTEFEVLSGMSLDFFGMGEYPYNTILQEAACETVATDLKSLGYTAHAIHNNTGTFYNRNKVFAQLGFDTFTPLEFMQNVEYNPIGWARDKVLTDEILKALNDTSGVDFVFAITVQGHGKYQQGADSEEMADLGITWADEEQDNETFTYYVSQLRETDAFIGELVKTLEHRSEPTVLVFYGDHLPGFQIGAEQLENGDIFQTEYVIWDNFGLPVKKKDLSAYQLSAEVLGRLGIGSGLLTRYHQQTADSEDYLDGLRLLEYDMLYGEAYCYGGRNPYMASQLKMGITPITISNAVWEDGVLQVNGANFTQWSCIAIDGTALETTWVDDKTLTAELSELPETGSVITVQQNTPSQVTLSESVGVFLDD